MVWRNILRVFFILFLVSLCSVVPAVTAQSVDDDSSGNIRIELTRLDQGRSYVFVLVGVLVALSAVIVALVFVIRSRFSSKMSAPVDDAGSAVVVRPEREASHRDGQYYGEVFGSRVSASVLDEKAQSRVLGDGSVDRYLKEDERIIINVLRMKHNSCSQATLRVVTDFSKARLSRILSELEQRGVVFKEPRGRKNIITLRA